VCVMCKFFRFLLPVLANKDEYTVQGGPKK